ncbi:MAG: hypothetical protein J5651_02755 [Salinivirgaceae bacterium]|nr:hypothetical protein [Salinivirgaceae bacterium]
MKKIFLILVLGSIFCSCNDPFEFFATDKWRGFLFYNYSNKEIVLFGDYVSKDSIPDQITTYVFEFDKSRDEHELRDYRFNDSKSKKLDRGDTLSIFIIDKEVYYGNSWEIIRDSNLISKRFFLNKGSDNKIYYYGEN